MRMNKKKISAVLLFSLFIVALAFSVILYLDKTSAPSAYVTEKIQEQSDGVFFKRAVDRIPAKAVVFFPQMEENTIRVGVSADPNELNFGLVVQNMSVRKFLGIKNKDVDVKICVLAYGNISEFIQTRENNIIVRHNESRELMLEFRGKRIGNYSGEIDVITKKPKYSFLNPLLPWVAC